MAWNFLWYKAGEGGGGTIIQIVAPPVRATKDDRSPQAIALNELPEAVAQTAIATATQSAALPRAIASNSIPSATKVCP